MNTDPALLVGIGTALASLFGAIYLNRRKINELRSWAWGRERDETDTGLAGEKKTLRGSVDSIEAKLDDELEERRRDHAEVEREVRVNRRYFADSIENLTATLNEQLPEADVDVERDVEPDWVTDGNGDDDRSYYGADRPTDDD